MQTGSVRRKVQFWLGMGVSLACLALIFVFVKPADVLVVLKTVHLGYLGLSGLGILTFMVLRAVRWRILLNGDVPYGRVFHVQNIGYMLLNTLPFRVGDLARAFLIGRIPPVSATRGLSTLVVERILDLLFIVLLVPLTAGQLQRLPAEVTSAVRLSGIAAATAIVALIIAANQRTLVRRLATAALKRLPFLNATTWARRIDELLAGFSGLSRLGQGLTLGLLTIVTWLPIIAAYYNGMLAVGLRPTVVMAAFVVCAAGFTVSAPSSPGQVGVFHAGVTFALVQLLGQPAAASASFALLYHALNLVLMVLLGLIGVWVTDATLYQVFHFTKVYSRTTD
ncbi:MAG: lysylphosphatidylglycerol synthase transmembrane domain-containing protein [Chloroflexota bacterium]